MSGGQVGTTEALPVLNVFTCAAVREYWLDYHLLHRTFNVCTPFYTYVICHTHARTMIKAKRSIREAERAFGKYSSDNIPSHNFNFNFKNHGSNFFVKCLPPPTANKTYSKISNQN